MKKTIDFAKFQNLDTLIFALVSQQRIIVVGETEEGESFIENIKDLLPSELGKKITEGTEKTDIIRIMPMSEQTFRMVESNPERYTLVLLQEKEIYGQYTSPFCKRIARLLQNNSIVEAKDELQVFFSKVVKTNEIVSASDYAKDHGMPKADAVLLLLARANYFQSETEIIFPTLEV